MSMIRRAVFPLALAATAALATPTDAQGPVAEPGTRIRVTIANGHQRMQGQFIRPMTDSLELAWSDSRGDKLQQPIALKDISQVEISGSRRHPLLKTTLQGAALGVAFGIVAGRFMGDPKCAPGGSCVSNQEAMVMFGVGLGSVGGGLGFIRAVKGFDVWIPASVPGWRRP
jgi:hypothetical protein